MDENLDADTQIAWTLIGAYLVFFMQCGFAMLEAGTVRAQNTVNILLKNLIDSCVAALVWWGIGYPIAFGETHGAIRGFSGGAHFFMANVETSQMPLFYSHWIFQWAFAATAATIVSGAAAERCRYQAYVIYTIVITGIVYPIVVHWVWSEDGWLSAANEDRTFKGSLGLLDFAGSSVVHVTGGGAAFFAAWFLGPRMGRYDDSGHPVAIHSNDQSLMMLGSFVLWFGWYAFNTASATCVENCMVTASLAAVNTTLSAATSSITVLLIHIVNGNTVQIAPALNGLLAGLVGITAGCAVVQPFAAGLIGIASAVAYYLSSRLLHLLHVDDPLEASAVHFSPGVVGTIAIGFFATETNVRRAYPDNFITGKTDYGVLYGGAGLQLCIQILGTTLIALWTCTINCILFASLSYAGKLRVQATIELHRLNAAVHNGPPYSPSPFQSRSLQTSRP